MLYETAEKKLGTKLNERTKAITQAIIIQRCRFTMNLFSEPKRFLDNCNQTPRTLLRFPYWKITLELEGFASIPLKPLR